MWLISEQGCNTSHSPSSGFSGGSIEGVKEKVDCTGRTNAYAYGPHLSVRVYIRGFLRKSVVQPFVDFVFM